MDPTVIGAILTGLATIAAAIIGVTRMSQRKKKDSNPEPSIESSPQFELASDTSNGPRELIKPRSDVQPPVELPEEQKMLMTSGVVHVLRERILKRVIEHLDPSVRRYESRQAVEESCKLLAAKIRDDKFTPDIIIGWENLETEYPGSQNIAELMSRELKVQQRLIKIQERDECRKVNEDCQWFRNVGRALIVDDACYSGNTLRCIQQKLNKLNPDADIRFAVLSTQDPSRLSGLYYLSTHNTEELLFPWGWSRMIVGFYDIYKMFGILDRYTVWHEDTGWGATHTIAKNFTGNVRLLTIEQGEEFQQVSNRENDTFLYLVSGAAIIRISDKRGLFDASQYIFIPRLVGYIIKANCKTVVLELAAGEN